jgi:hypothetical protein
MVHRVLSGLKICVGRGGGGGVEQVRYMSTCTCSWTNGPPWWPKGVGAVSSDP